MNPNNLISSFLPRLAPAKMAFAAALTALGTAQADVNEWFFEKAVAYEQTADNTAPTQPTSWGVYIAVVLDNETDANSVTISGGGLVGSFPLSYNDGEWEYSREYNSEATMDIDFPNGGTYTLTLSGGTLGTVRQEFTLAAKKLPTIPYFTGKDLSLSQSVDPTYAYQLNWNATDTAANAVWLEIESHESDSDAYDIDFEGSLPRSTSIPAMQLAKDSCYTAQLSFVNTQTMTGERGFGITGYFDQARVTKMPLNTLNTLSPQAIVGAWQFGDGASNDSGALVFLANGTYFHAEDIVEDGSDTDGIERGTYSWDPTTGALTVSTDVDTNGTIGLSHPNGQFTVQLDQDGTGITISDSGGSTHLDRVGFNSADWTEGGWALCDEKGLITACLVFLPNNRYFHMEVYSADGSNGNDDDNGATGMELGTYSYDSGLQRLVATSIDVDTNNEYGLSDPIVGYDILYFPSPRVVSFDDTNGNDAPGFLHRVSNASVKNGWRINKSASYTQTSNNSAPATPDSWDAWCWVGTRNPGDARSVSISGGGISGSAAFSEEDPGDWTYDRNYPSSASLNSEFPDNQTYTIILSGGALGTLSQSLDIGSQAFPIAPYLTGTNFTDIQSVDPTAGTNLQWNGSGAYSMQLFVSSLRDEEGDELFDSGILSGGETSQLLAPGTLPAGSTSYGYLEFAVQPASSFGRGGFGTFGFSGRQSALNDFVITTQSAATVISNTISNAGLGGSDAALLAAPNDDGVPNLIKYAFNMDLTAPDNNSMSSGGNGGLPVGNLAENEAGEPVLRVEYVRRKGSGLVYSAVKSSTLGTFTPMVGQVTVETIGGPGSQWERVIVDEPCDPATVDQCFSRVEVTLP